MIINIPEHIKEEMLALIHKFFILSQVQFRQ